MEIGLECRICGHREKYNLNKHLKELHQLTTKEYKSKYPKSRTMTGHSKRTVEYWVYRGYSYEEGLEQVKNTQKQGKDLYIENVVKQGISLEEAQEMWNIKQAKNSPRSLEYYQNRGMTEEAAIKERSSVQSTYSKLSSKFKGHTHTVESRKLIGDAIKKQIQKEGAKSRVNRFYQKRDKHISKAEKDCYLELVKHIPLLQANVNIQGKVIDMLIGTLIIEFYGDFWHRNPEKYGKDLLLYGKTSEDVWEKDKSRLRLLESYGYSSYIIWEGEWGSRKDSIILEIKKKLYENTDQVTDRENQD